MPVTEHEARRREIPGKEVVEIARALISQATTALSSNPGFLEALLKHAFEVQEGVFTEIEQGERDFHWGRSKQVRTQISFTSDGRQCSLQYTKDRHSTGLLLERDRGKDDGDMLSLSYTDGLGEPFLGVVHVKSPEGDRINTRTAVARARSFIASI